MGAALVILRRGEQYTHCLERERVGVPTIGRLVVDLAAVPIHRRIDVAQRPVQVLKQSQLLPFVNLKDGGARTGRMS